MGKMIKMVNPKGGITWVAIRRVNEYLDLGYRADDPKDRPLVILAQAAALSGSKTGGLTGVNFMDENPEGKPDDSSAANASEEDLRQRVEDFEQRAEQELGGQALDEPVEEEAAQGITDDPEAAAYTADAGSARKPAKKAAKAKGK